MPVVGLIIGGIDFTGMKATVGDASIAYGNFVQNIVNFLIISLSIFLFVKLINKLTRKNEAKKEAEAKKDPQIELLEEIRQKHGLVYGLSVFSFDRVSLRSIPRVILQIYYPIPFYLTSPLFLL